MEISREKLNEFTELLEDSVQYFADENIFSGELLWTVVECLATAKVAELKNELPMVS